MLKASSDAMKTVVDFLLGSVNIISAVSSLLWETLAKI